MRFFFSSRRRHTRLVSDWSSDVCSSDLYLDTLLKSQGRAIEVVTQAENDQEDLMADLTAILYSFTARLYGQRRAKRKTETVIRALEAGESEGEHATG